MQYRRLAVFLLSGMLAMAGCGASPQGTNISVSDVGNVEGTVTDASTGNPLSGVTIQIGDKSDVTDDNGVYSLQDISVGTRTVTASKTEYQNHNGTCEVSKGTTVSHDIQLTANTSSDTTPPTVSSTSPANNATDIAVNGAITVTFSEAMDVSTVTTSTFILEQGTTPVPGTVTYSGTTATFTPLSNLSYSTSYTATITTGVKDTAGNGLTTNYRWDFTTGVEPDTTLPAVSSTSPANNATGVAVNGAITATFSENMDASSINTATFTLKEGATSIPGIVAYSGTTATFTPSSNLSYSTTYTATITTGTKDASGNAMAANYTWSFTTGAAPDTTPPTVSSTSPASNVTSVTVNSAITATFSETMDSSTVTTATFTLKQGTTAIAGAVTYNGTTATFTPSSNLSYSTTYTATVSTGAKDSAGNAMTSNYAWSFTTGAAPDTTPPTVSSMIPVSNATGVAINSAITAIFSENMDASSINTNTMTFIGPSGYVIGSVNYSETMATFTPLSNLVYETAYTATITTATKDLAGNALTGNYTWSFTTESAPSSVISVAAGNYYSLALKSNGTVWAWGGNGEGQLGDGTTTKKVSPVQVSGVTTAVAIAASYVHSLALKSDGTVLAWGRNNDGQLGNGTLTDRSTPGSVTGLTNVTAICAGRHSMALKSDGTVWAWGNNEGGQLGDGTTINRATPIQISGIFSVVAISCGEVTSMALRSDGTVWAWGWNYYGQVGDGTTANRSTPIQVAGLSNMIAIASGRVHSLAVRDDGKVYAWGGNYKGELGDGTNTKRLTPVPVNSLTDVLSVDAGAPSHSLALKNDGTVWAWGCNLEADGTTTDRYTPVQVNNLNNIVAVTTTTEGSSGCGHSLALAIDGTVWAWGYNGAGQLGDGTTNSRYAPGQVSGL